jgi:hypothetical protein
MEHLGCGETIFTEPELSRMLQSLSVLAKLFGRGINDRSRYSGEPARNVE